MSFRIISALGVLLGTLVSCAHEEVEINYGLQLNHSSFVPARVAVLHCQEWPNGARYKTLPLTNFSKDDVQQICKKFDDFVINGYDGQPYMRGISQKGVKRRLDKKLGEEFLQKVSSLWQHLETDCQNCTNPAQFYTLSIAERQQWRQWLVELSKNAKSADAVLLPMVTYGYNRTVNDRGVMVQEKGAGLTMLLIDTNNGYLLWAGGREAVSSNQSFHDNNAPLEPPTDKSLYQRLFTDDIWKDFPGRQVYH